MIHGPLWALESCLSIHHDYFLEHTTLPFLCIFKNHLHLASPPMIPLSFHPADPIETLPLDSHLKSWSQPGTLPPAFSNHRFFNFLGHSCSQLTAAWGHLGPQRDLMQSVFLDTFRFLDTSPWRKPNSVQLSKVCP